MKCNQNIQIKCDRIVLVPYENKHVLKYHEWMKSEELQILTASEALTLHQEYEMQLSWRNDENSNEVILQNCSLYDYKCTFIVLDKARIECVGNTEIDSMVGDVNLFFNDDENPRSAEIEIMIAEKEARGKGLGKESLLCMMRYGFENLNVASYTAKIGYDNAASLRLFHKLEFVEVSRSDVFKEVTLQLDLSDSVKHNITSATKLYEIVAYTS